MTDSCGLEGNVPQMVTRGQTHEFTYPKTPEDACATAHGLMATGGRTEEARQVPAKIV
eukprot:CAMPEP_0204569478 /NCGR_PEP_ID=MMETSP0661-20131031/37765_1 /ASSEMBLY_ACC=CAM_ASM_000606 /TAXON_ID=109239 /ORGANISM="Alexandrium margalefi, Strain AMGDE01CS-322" /LENGTH=57 /DNA_ID=CAMNT_0051577581 /DNA_START=87 /DNA_END=257 /DNA_ORIENTATION=-